MCTIYLRPGTSRSREGRPDREVMVNLARYNDKSTLFQEPNYTHEQASRSFDPDHAKAQRSQSIPHSTTLSESSRSGWRAGPGKYAGLICSRFRSKEARVSLGLWGCIPHENLTFRPRRLVRCDTLFLAQAGVLLILLHAWSRSALAPHARRSARAAWASSLST